MIKNDIRSWLKELDEHIKKEYNVAYPVEEEGSWRTDEQISSKRIRDVVKALDPLIHEAVSTKGMIKPRAGRPDILTQEQKVKILLIKQLVGESNRTFARMLDVFSMLSGTEVSYKMIERLYSDDEVMMALQNLRIIILKKRGLDRKSSCASGDDLATPSA